MHMCVDVNKNTLLSGKNVFYFTNTHTHTHTRIYDVHCHNIMRTFIAMSRIVQYSYVVNG